MKKLLLAALLAAVPMSAVLAQDRAQDRNDSISQEPDRSIISDASPQAAGAAADPEATQLPAVVVTGTPDSYTVPDSSAAAKLPLSLREIPQSVTVITRERMDDQHLESLRDVLDNTTGVYSYAWDTERVSFTARGFVIDNLMYDGVQTSTSVDTSSIDDSLDTALYDRIEIVRGATGLMTGAGSPSAAVNLVRKRADSKIFEGEAGLSAGSWNNYRADVDLAAPLTSDGSVRGRIVGAYQYAESYQDLYHRPKTVLYATVDADLSPTTLLSLGYDYQETRAHSNTWGSFPMFFTDGTRTDWPRSVTTAADWSHWNRNTQSVFAELRQEFGEGWSLRTTLTHRWKEGDYKLLYFGGFPDRTTGVGIDQGPDGDGDGLPDYSTAYGYNGTESDRLSALDAYVSGPFNWFGRKHELVAGISASRLAQSGINYDPLPGAMAPAGNFYQWDGSYPEPAWDYSIAYTNDSITNQTSAYSAVRLSLADPLKLIAGVRYTDWNSEGSATAGQKYGAHPFIPYAGLVGDIGHGFSLFSSYTQIFSPQSARDRTGKYLDPIVGKSIEVGAKGSHLGGRLNTSLTLFDTRQDNVAARDPDIDPNTGLPYQLPDGTDASIAIDGTRTRGVEAEVSGEIARRWNLSLGGSLYQLKDANGQQVNTHIPRGMLRVFSTWSPSGDWSKLTVGGGANWQSRSYAMLNSPTGYQRVDQQPVLLVNLMARYQITPQLSAQLNGNNLLDRKYYVLDNYDDTYYGAPASYVASLNLRF